MKGIKQIDWQPHEMGDLKGMLNAQEVFTIKHAKKNNQLELVSWGLHSETFSPGSKRPLGIFDDIESAQKFAQKKLEEYLQLFFEDSHQVVN